MVHYCIYINISMCAAIHYFYISLIHFKKAYNQQFNGIINYFIRIKVANHQRHLYAYIDNPPKSLKVLIRQVPLVGFSQTPCLLLGFMIQDVLQWRVQSIPMASISPVAAIAMLVLMVPFQLPVLRPTFRILPVKQLLVQTIQMAPMSPVAAIAMRDFSAP